MPFRRIGLVPWLPFAPAVFLLLIFMLFLAHTASAQPGFAKGTIGDAVLVLNGPWKFHPGDNMEWARPNFDDSSWGSLDLTPPEGSYDPITGSSGFVPGWTATGYPKLEGYAWYRLHVRVENLSSSAGAVPLALTMPLNFDDAYQVFVNGRLIGQFGRFGPKSVVFYNAQPRSFALPGGTSPGVLTVAIRLWMDSATPFATQDAGGLHGPPLLGEASAIDAMLRLEWDAVNQTQIAGLLSVTFLFLAALLGFTLYWFDRSEPAYLWLGAVCLATFVARGTVMLGYYSTFMSMVSEVFLQDVILSPLTLGLWALFWAHWFRLENMRRIVRITWILIALLAMGMAMIRSPLFGKMVPVEAIAWLLPATLVLKLSLGVVLLWVTYRGIRTQAADGWLALAPILLTVVWAYQEEMAVFHMPPILRIADVTINYGVAAILLMLAIISVLMMRRFIRGLRESVQIRLEIEQARQVQQVLIPEALPSISGFAVASEYCPARQVGGDFFQILPTPNGGVLAVIGDVSGKGAPAAMTVSLLVGAVRTLASYTQKPGEILSALNQCMLGRSQGGFTTCLVFRADPDGALTIANAGHLSPYLDGRELEISSALPLGLAEGRYVETAFHLDEGRQLTFLTDGVLEARRKSGELFGFERTASIAKDSAVTIVRKAQEFGQSDDITVLTITRLAATQKSPLATEDQVEAVSPASSY